MKQILITILSLQLICAFRHVHASMSDFKPMNSNENVASLDDDSLILEPINGTPDFRINRMKDLYYKPWFDSRDYDHRFVHCVRPAKCEKLKNNTCFGSKLPYTWSSLALTDSLSLEESHQKLQEYEALRNIPKCWAVIQPFLCAVFAPKCELIKNRDMVYLPALEMCRTTLEPCRMLYNTSFFPRFLQCNETFFPSKCNNDVREIKFNIVGRCVPPLVQAESAMSYYKEIDGCGLQCKDPLYNDDEHEYVHMLIGWGIGICATFNAFVVATYFIHEWKKYEYPAKNIFYINICFLINWIGWLIQFYPGNRENIVCRKDGTLRRSEPSAGEANLFCLLSFILIYYFLMAAMFWFAFFTYAWYLQTSDRCFNRDRIDKKKSYFHLIAWIMPFVLTITVLVLSEVDGNSMVGICFVGFRNHTVRIGLVLFPVSCLLMLSASFFLAGMLRLNTFKKNVHNNKASIKLQSIKSNVITRCATTILFIGAWIIFQFYEFDNATIWTQSLNDMILCKIKSAYSGSNTKCKLEHRPSVTILLLRLICIFGMCIANASWCWRKSAFDNWRKCIQRLRGHEIKEDEKFTKPTHKLIADAYAKRNESLLAISLVNTQTDPAGVNFNVSNLNVHESNEMTSSLRNYMPNLLLRRNAMTNRTIHDRTSNNNGKCHTCSSSCDTDCNMSYSNSCESEMIRIQTVSVECESRRTSIDSTVSVKMSETEVKVMSNTVSKRHRKKKKQQHTQHTSHGRKRKDSSSSGSEIIQSIKNKLRSKNHLRQSKSYSANVVKNPKTNRRGACTGIDVRAIKTLLKQQTTQTRRNDNEDEVSIASVQMHQALSHFVATRDQNGNNNMDSSDEYSETEVNEQHVQSAIMKMNDGAAFGLNRKCSAYRNAGDNCDIGIQANALDIASKVVRRNDNNRHHAFGDENENQDLLENHHLLAIRNNEHNSTMRRSDKENGNEKLMKLLLP